MNISIDVTRKEISRIKFCIFYLFFLVVLSLGVYVLAPILKPFFWGMVFAYLGYPIVLWLCTKGMGRIIAVVLVFSFVFLILFLLMVILIPLILKQINMLVQLAPSFYEWINYHVLENINVSQEGNGFLSYISQFVNKIQHNWQQAGNVFVNMLKVAKNSSSAIVQMISNLFLIPMVSFYLLKDWDVFFRYLRNIIPPKWRKSVISTCNECDDILKNFIKGQLFIIFIMGVFYIVGLAVVGVKFFVLLGILFAVFCIIPYMTLILGAIVTAIIYFFQPDSMETIVGFISVFLFGQFLEGWFLTPKLVGEKIGLHPLAIIFSLMAGGYLFGVVGLVLSLPVSAIVAVFMQRILNNCGTEIVCDKN